MLNYQRVAFQHLSTKQPSFGWIGLMDLLGVHDTDGPFQGCAGKQTGGNSPKRRFWWGKWWETLRSYMWFWRTYPIYSILWQTLKIPLTPCSCRLHATDKYLLTFSQSNQRRSLFASRRKLYPVWKRVGINSKYEWNWSNLSSPRHIEWNWWFSPKTEKMLDWLPSHFESPAQLPLGPLVPGLQDGIQMNGQIYDLSQHFIPLQLPSELLDDDSVAGFSGKTLQESHRGSLHLHPPFWEELAGSTLTRR